MISVYCVGRRVTEGEGRVYQQHLREIMRNGNIPLDTTPYDLFCNDLISQLQTWVAQGDRIIMMMDANEHVLNGPLCRRLRDEELGLDLEEVSHKVWGGREINTHIDGSEPIDGVWVSRKLEVGGFLILPFSQSVGDHRSFAFEVTTRSLIGVFDHKVVRPDCRRLNTRTSSLG